MSSFRLDRNLFALEQLEIRRLLTSAFVDSNHTLQVLGTSSSETITVNRNSSGRLTVSGVSGSFAIGGGSGQANKIFVQAGSGNDNVLLTNNIRFPSNNQGIPATIAGNNGNDTLVGGPGNDVLSGNDGADTMDGGVGNDLITGGANTDTTNYSNRGSAIRVSINSNADADGELSIGENDKVETEEVIGGAGNDTLIGSSLQDFMAGGGGADSITGNGGNDAVIGSTGLDRLFGNDGNDYIGAQNSDRDTVNGGGGSLDLASVDSIDVSGLAAAARAAAAAAADNEESALDSTYGDTGIALSPDVNWSGAAAAVVDEQGRVYFVGNQFNSDSSSGAAGNDIVIARFTAEGQFDTTFGTGGVAIVDFTAENGSEGGNDDDFAGGITLDSDGSIVVVGSTTPQFGSGSAIAIARLTDTGQLDTTFGGNGMTVASIGGGSSAHAEDVVVQADGKIVAVGYHVGEGQDRDFAVVRVTEAGLLDSDFNDSGVLIFPVGDFSVFDQANAVALQNFPGDEGAQRIVIAGVSGGDAALARLLPEGTLDDSFDGDGKLTADFAGTDLYHDVAVNSLNQIVAVGETSGGLVLDSTDLVAAAPNPGETNAILAVYAPDAATAPTVFEQPPITDTSAITYQAVVIDDQDRIVIAGTDFNDFIVARFLPTAAFDASFNTGHVITDISFGDNAFGVGVDPGGKVIAAGTTLLPNESTALTAVRYGGQGDHAIEQFIPYADLQANPPGGPLAPHLEERSEWAKLYMRSQLDDDGVARINTSDPRDNVVTIYNVLTGDDTANVAVSIDGLVLFYDLAQTKLIQIHLGGGDDSITFLDEVGIPFVLDLGEGDDAYDGVHGNHYILGGPGDDDLKGGSGSDLLVGGPGNDNINGGPGRDLLIGGDGADRINSTSGEDLVIAGTTAHDGDGAALYDILQEWASSASLDTRVNNIRTGGGLNGTSLLRTGAAATVSDDGEVDHLQGAGGQNWFFFSDNGPGQDKVSGDTEDDEVDLI